MADNNDTRTDPRHFPVGSPEPDDVRAVRSDQNHVVFRRGEHAESRTWYASTESGGDGLGYSWYQLNGEQAEEGGMPLTEVLPAPSRPPVADNDQRDPVNVLGERIEDLSLTHAGRSIGTIASSSIAADLIAEGWRKTEGA